MPDDLKGYRVFIASPGGLGTERNAFHDTLLDHNEADAVSRGATFIPVGWEITLGGVGRPQDLINEDVRKCDYFVLLLWDRWGSRPSADDKAAYTSGTEEEYHVALECLDDPEMPMRQIVAFFRAVNPRQLSDPGPQLAKVLEFKKKLEREKTLLFHTYDDVPAFEKRLRRHLAQWVRDHEQGLPAKPAPPTPLPDLEPTGPTRSELRGAEPPTPPAESDLVQQAEQLADEGRLTEADGAFATAISKGDDPDALSRYGRFLHRVGRLTQAQSMFERVLDLATTASDLKWQAKATGNLGLIYDTRGDLDQAEAMHRKALEIDEKLGRPERMAVHYGNLGLIHWTRGDLDQAEAMHRKALDINEKLSRREGMAVQYGNLGLIHMARGHLDQAEAMHRKALDIDVKLGRPEGMANNYCSLGLIYKARGDLDQAEAMHRNALDIDVKLGRLEGMAAQYANLGSISEQRGDLDEARNLWTKAHDLYAKIGMPHMVEKVQAWLDELPPSSPPDDQPRSGPPQAEQ